MIPGAHPILSLDAASALEGSLFQGDPEKEWPAMVRAGTAVADGILSDFSEIGGFPKDGRVLLLIGKGHNGGDAALAGLRILECFPGAHIEACLAAPRESLKPLARRALDALSPKAMIIPEPKGAYDLTIDGVYGFNFRPPLDGVASRVLQTVNGLPIRFRAAIDLPSGLGEPGAFRADFTYATGIVKSPLLELPNAGRLRYLDLGFFQVTHPSTKDHVLTADVLWPLRTLRNGHSDKRHHGHVFILAGSMNFPGAAMMAALGAIHAGAGLVSAFVPHDLVPPFAARLPEVIWVGMPVHEKGGMGWEGLPSIRERLSRASALVIGPGMGSSPETLHFVTELLSTADIPAVIDADAIQPQILSSTKVPLILTPHEGEFLRLGPVTDPRHVVVRKGPVTRIYQGDETWHSFFGGPVLARGGSGDILSGIMGTLLAQTPADSLGAAVRAVAWHGLAGDMLAREKGTRAVRTTDLIDRLGPVLFHPLET